MNAGEQRGGVELTNLDQPLSPDAGATKRDLVDYLDAVADRMLPGLAGRPLTVMRVLRGQAPFMQKNVPKYTPDWVQDRADMGRGVQAGGALRAVRRPAHAAVVRQPARRRVPPDSGPGRQHLPAHAPGARPRPARRRRLRRRGGRRPPGASGAGGRRLGRRGEDERREGHARVRADRRPAPVDDVAAATRALAARAEALDPAMATTAFIVEDRGGKVFVDSTRVGGATVVAAYSPRLRPGTPVSFPLDWSDLDPVTPGRLHGAHGARRAWRARSVGRVDARATAAADRPDRAGPHHPRRPGAAMHEGKRRARARRADT